MLKVLEFSKSGLSSLRNGAYEFWPVDFVQFPKSLRPGEWVFFMDPKEKTQYLGMANPFAVSPTPQALLLTKWNPNSWPQEKEWVEEKLAPFYIETKIKEAKERREILSDYENFRLVYGQQDGLPGLVIDRYENMALIEIHTAGLDRYREILKAVVQKLCPEVPVYFHDVSGPRQREMLPEYGSELPSGSVLAKENGLALKVPMSVIQKNGLYFDHRENRRKMVELLKRVKAPMERGLDLFSYVGSWGLHQLQAGVKEVTFVDQGDFSQAISDNLSLNNMSGRGEFIRGDVFKLIEEFKSQGRKFQVITVDPPAFAKSPKQKAQALHGYRKLMTSALGLLAPHSFLMAGSCTRYIDLLELNKEVVSAAQKLGRSIQLLELGAHGLDHPISALDEKGSYLKFLGFYVR